MLQNARAFAHAFRADISGGADQHVSLKRERSEVSVCPKLLEHRQSLFHVDEVEFEQFAKGPFGQAWWRLHAGGGLLRCGWSRAMGNLLELSKQQFRRDRLGDVIVRSGSEIFLARA